MKTARTPSPGPRLMKGSHFCPFPCNINDPVLLSPPPPTRQVGDISGADFTDALIRKDVAKTLCLRPDAKGTNPTTEVDTRDSLLCEMF